MTTYISSGSSASDEDGLRGLRERIQKIGELCMNADKTMRDKCLYLHKKTVWILALIEERLELMPREKLIYTVTEVATALKDVEEDLQHWTKHNYFMKLIKKDDMCSLINSHHESFWKIFILLLSGLIARKNFSDSFENPKDLGVQILNFKLGQDYEIVPAAEMDAETEASPSRPEALFRGLHFYTYKISICRKARCYVAAKAYDRESDEVTISRLKENAEIWRSMKHPNILPFLAICRFDQDMHVRLLSPWMKNGTVRSYLSTHPGVDRVKLIYDVARGLQHLHENGVLHRNLKGSNILVDLSGAAVISGLSRSKILGPDSKGLVERDTYGDERRWAPPESLPKWGKEGDIWAWSMTAVEILSGDRPFKSVKEWCYRTTVRVYVEGSLRPTPDDYLPQQIASSEIWDVLNKCWNTEPEGRINIEEVVVSLESEMKANGWDPSAPIRVPKLEGEDPMAS